jgi:hypothetical protein
MASNNDSRVTLSKEEALALKRISKDAILQVIGDGLVYDAVSSTIVLIANLIISITWNFTLELVYVNFFYI